MDSCLCLSHEMKYDSSTYVIFWEPKNAPKYWSFQLRSSRQKVSEIDLFDLYTPKLPFLDKYDRSPSNLYKRLFLFESARMTVKMTKMVVNFSMSKMAVAQILAIMTIFGKRSFWPQINGHFWQRFFLSVILCGVHENKKNRSTLWTLTVGCSGSMILYTWTWLTLTLIWPRAFGQSNFKWFQISGQTRTRWRWLSLDYLI